MIVLYGFGTGFGLPEISPFVTKTEVQLKMAGLSYRKERAMPPASPKGQLPFVEDDGMKVESATFTSSSSMNGSCPLGEAGGMARSLR